MPGPLQKIRVGHDEPALSAAILFAHGWMIQPD